MRWTMKAAVGLGLVVAGGCGTEPSSTGGSSGEIAGETGEPSSSTGEDLDNTSSTDEGSGSGDESSSSSSGLPSEVCGDGVTEGEEVCDDGINDGAYGGCQPDCGALAPYCGDALVDDGESCDDGNDVEGDGCNACTAAGTVEWSDTLANAALLDAERFGDDGVRIAIEGAEVPSPGVQVLTIASRGAPLGDLALDGLTPRQLVLHSSGAFVVHDGPDLVSYDAGGISQWTYELPEPPLVTTSRRIGATGDGGGSFATFAFEPTTVGLVDATGALLWEAPVDVQIEALVVTPDGGVVTAASQAGSNALTLTRYETDGAMGFETEIAASSETALLSATDGGFALCWRTDGIANYGAAKLSVGGDIEWSGSFGVRDVYQTTCHDITVLADGDVAVFERAGDIFAPTPFVRRIRDGRTGWSRELETRSPAGLSARLVEDPGGKLIVAFEELDSVRIVRIEP